MTAIIPFAADISALAPRDLHSINQPEDCVADAYLLRGSESCSRPLLIFFLQLEYGFQNKDRLEQPRPSWD